MTTELKHVSEYELLEELMCRDSINKESSIKDAFIKASIPLRTAIIPNNIPILGTTTSKQFFEHIGADILSENTEQIEALLPMGWLFKDGKVYDPRGYLRLLRYANGIKIARRYNVFIDYDDMDRLCNLPENYFRIFTCIEDWATRKPHDRRYSFNAIITHTENVEVEMVRYKVMNGKGWYNFSEETKENLREIIIQQKKKNKQRLMDEYPEAENPFAYWD